MSSHCHGIDANAATSIESNVPAAVIDAKVQYKYIAQCVLMCEQHADTDTAVTQLSCWRARVLWNQMQLPAELQMNADR